MAPTSATSLCGLRRRGSPGTHNCEKKFTGLRQRCKCLRGFQEIHRDSISPKVAGDPATYPLSPRMQVKKTTSRCSSAHILRSESSPIPASTRSIHSYLNIFTQPSLQRKKWRNPRSPENRINHTWAIRNTCHLLQLL
jgi:hypothetical protein